MSDVNDRPGSSFWIGLVVGWVVMAIGLVGLIATRSDSKPFEVAFRFAELLLVHDGVVAPLAFLAGAIATRWLPPPARGPVRGALALSAIVAVFAIPLVKRLGARQNSSVLPLSYGPNLAIVLGMIWVVAVVVTAGRLLTTRRQRRRPSSQRYG
jgi:hypothetical protein